MVRLIVRSSRRTSVSVGPGAAIVLALFLAPVVLGAGLFLAGFAAFCLVVWAASWLFGRR